MTKSLGVSVPKHPQVKGRGALEIDPHTGVTGKLSPQCNQCRKGGSAVMGVSLQESALPWGH